ncbi:disease resistance protein RUN1-like [Eucalyptus grandis]|uniref:disease resistance protein RUN1-like n=1 Tax=Eucalyptus grandis TaxID=71139 RepID=UPI00192EA37F|nr:disease resistance protein RUN1-like [Eucalyptus grandis]
MGGIGKTTLAKVVYNKLSDQFQDHSFIADIRESSRSKGIAHLQEQLIFDILKENDLVSNTDEGIGIIASRFKRKKVLILLDDVDNNDQVKALVGKRDWFGMGSKIIITTRISSVLDQAEVKCKYALKEIADDESLILFSRHAFRKDSPPCEFEPLSCDVVSTIRGLPLALEVIGSNLCGRDEEYWQDALKKLKDVPHERVQKTLKISYDALNYEEKHIFLDIACFFIGADLRYASYMWDACKLYPKLGIETLSFMSLIKIGDDGKVQMHDQLRDLGRDIVRQEDYNMPMKRSRLWVHEEALEVLERNKMAKHLKVLDLTHCRCLKVTPNLSAFQNLEIFRLKDCRNLKQIDPSIGAAKSLIFLDLQECDELRELPQEMCKLEKLKELDISETAIVEIPPCIGSLRKLEVLYAAGCKSLVGLPDSIRHLVNLSTLDLSFCPKLCKLPESIGYLVKLERLSCGFNYPHYHITDDRKFHRLSKLISFDAGICKLLESIGDLKNLKFLHIAFSNKLSNLPNTISKLGNLEELDATGCKSLGGEIHIDGLSSLKILRFKGTGVFGFHGTFDKLSHLEKLELDDCQMLQSLPKLPTSLTVLEVTGQHHTFPQLSHLIHLKKLTVVDCPLLESVPELPSGLSELSVHNCRKLKELPSLSRKLSNLDGLEHLESLKILRLQEIDQEIGPISNGDQFPGPEKLKNLEDLSVLECESLVRVDVSQLTHLKVLDFSGCHSLLEIGGLERLTNLTRLSFVGCPSIETLPDLSCFNNLQEVLVDECLKIPVVRGVTKARYLGGGSFECLPQRSKSKYVPPCNVKVEKAEEIDFKNRTRSNVVLCSQIQISPTSSAGSQ